jgi:hypothetical protein
MGRKRYTPEQIIGKLREAEVAITAIYQRFESNEYVFDMLIIYTTHIPLECKLNHQCQSDLGSVIIVRPGASQKAIVPYVPTLCLILQVGDLTPVYCLIN